MLGRSANRWKLVKQTVVAVSTLESEYVALSKACLVTNSPWALTQNDKK